MNPLLQTITNVGRKLKPTINSNPKQTLMLMAVVYAISHFLSFSSYLAMSAFFAMVAALIFFFDSDLKPSKEVALDPGNKNDLKAALAVLVAYPFVFGLTSALLFEYTLIFALLNTVIIISAKLLVEIMKTGVSNQVSSTSSASQNTTSTSAKPFDSQSKSKEFPTPERGEDKKASSEKINRDFPRPEKSDGGNATSVRSQDKNIHGSASGGYSFPRPEREADSKPKATTKTDPNFPRPEMDD